MSAAAAIAGFAAVGLLAGGGVTGYALGQSRATTETEAVEARKAAFAEAFKGAEDRISAQVRPEGLDAGRIKGRNEGERAGLAEGRGDAGQAIGAQETLAARSAPAPSTDPYDYSLSTTAEPVNGDCPPPLTYHMGICKLARPALPEECPPGWVPAGLTGACGPRRP